MHVLAGEGDCSRVPSSSCQVSAHRLSTCLLPFQVLKCPFQVLTGRLIGETDVYQQEGGQRQCLTASHAPAHPRVHTLAHNHLHSAQRRQRCLCLSCKRGAARLGSAGPETELKGAGHNP